MRVAFVQTAYWPQVVKAGLDARNSRNSSSGLELREFEIFGISANYIPSFRDLDHECLGLVFNSRSSRFETLDKVRKALDLKTSWRFWQHLSRIPMIGVALHEFSNPVQALRLELQEFSPDIVFFLNVNLVTPGLASWIKAQGWFLAGQHASPLPPKGWLTHFDYLVSALPWQVDFFRNLGVVTDNLALGIPRDFVVEDSLDFSERSIDISFIGSVGRHHRNSTELLRRVGAEFPGLRIFTTASPRKLRALGLGPFYAGEAFGKDAMNVYRNSKVVLNRHIAMARGFAVNFRMFEATASGAVLVTERAPNLNDFFVEGEEALAYSSIDEACDQIHQVLSDAEAGRRISVAGHLKTRHHHTFELRAVELESKMRAKLQVRPSGKC
jgi:hypothetical protein